MCSCEALRITGAPGQGYAGFPARAVACLKASHTAPGQGAGATDPDGPVLTPLTADVAIAYVVDEPQGLVFIQRRHLQGLVYFPGCLSPVQASTTAVINVVSSTKQ
jgi:hypothetical protein